MCRVRKILALVMAGALVTGLVGCGAQSEKSEQETASQTETNETEASEEASEEADNSTSESAKIPAYEYPGPELFYSVLYKYINDEFAANYDSADVAIPIVNIIYQDESNKEDIKVYGDFWYMNYDLKGDTLEFVSGGSYPGCIHMKTTDDGYSVTSMDIVEDGSNYLDSAKEIFGEHFDDFEKVSSDNEAREKVRAQIISNYVFANDLNIKAYQDQGWNPVTLPEQNIDSFYSILD